MRPLVLGIGGALLLLGVLLSIPSVIVALLPPTIWEKRTFKLLDEYTLIVPPDSEMTRIRYPIYGRHEYREKCVSYPSGARFQGDIENIRIELSFTELGGHPFNFYVIESSRENVLLWENKRNWEEQRTRAKDCYEKKGIISDSVEIPIGLYESRIWEGFCFIAENPNEEGIVVQVSATLEWEYEVNYSLRRQVYTAISFIGALLIFLGIIVLIVGFIVPSKTTLPPPPSPPPERRSEERAKEEEKKEEEVAWL